MTDAKMAIVTHRKEEDMNYYINGDAAKADQIKAAFSKFVSIQEMAECDFSQEEYLFYTGQEERGTFVYSTWVDGINANIIKTHPYYQELELPVEPKFKVGDTISTGKVHTTILQLDMDKQGYRCSDEWFVYFKNQDLWHLVPKPHYDIKNFHAGMPVLVRDGDSDDDDWTYVLFSHYNSNRSEYKFSASGEIFRQCIPFNGNEHLLGTADMPSEEFINW